MINSSIQMAVLPSAWLYSLRRCNKGRGQLIRPVWTLRAVLIAFFLTVSGEKVIEEQVTETEDENTVYIHPVVVQKGENHTFTFL